MIQNDVELECAQERIAYFSRLVAGLRKTESPESFCWLASPLLADLRYCTSLVAKFIRQLGHVL
jgi:hypothetical protein